MENPNIDNAETVKNPSPFITFTARTIPATFDTSMSYQEALFAVVNYLQTQVTPAINENAEITNEQTKVINELYDFVNHYFDNLDVQEEINNKLDDMAESGELEAILQQILNTLRVYDTVTEMIEDTSIQNGQRVMTLGYSSVTDNAGGVFTITNSEQTPNGLTVIELDNGLYALREYSDKIVVSDQTLLTTSVLTELLNKSVQIVTENPIEVTSTIFITTAGTTIHDMEFVGNTPNDEYIIRVDAKNVTIDRCKFSGVAGNYLRASGDGEYLTISNNILDGTNGSMTSGIVFWGTKHAKIHGNTFINMGGFNVQFIKCEQILVNDNTFSNPHYEGNYVSVGGETVIEFNTGGINPRRQGLRIDSVKTTSYSMSYDSETSIATITLQSSIQGVKTVTFRCYNSLEIININGHCHDITVTSNTLEGTGDSGIVIASDYHENSLAPSSVTLADFPRNIVVSDNVIRDCAYSGIAITHRTSKISVTNNLISNYGWISTSDIYNSGIFYPILYVSKDIIISGNSFSNSSTSMWGETENGIGKYGVVINPTQSSSTTEEYTSWMNGEGSCHITNNNCDSGILLYKTYAFDTLICQINYNLDAKRMCELPTKLNQTADDNGYHLGISAGSLSTTTSNNMSVISLNFNATGDRYCTVENTITNAIEDCELIYGFWAKADVDGSIFRVMYRQGNNQKENASLLIGTSWKYYEYKILIGSKTNRTLLQGRINPSSECRNILLRDIQMRVKYYN